MALQTTLNQSVIKDLTIKTIGIRKTIQPIYCKNQASVHFQKSTLYNVFTTAHIINKLLTNSNKVRIIVFS